MTISIVNGYVCMSGCDVAKAKKGQDPHPSTHGARTDGKDQADDRGPAVLLGGSLIQGLTSDAVNAIDSAAGTDGAAVSPRRFALDVLA